MRASFVFCLPLLVIAGSVADAQPRPTARLNTTATVQGMGPRMLLVTTEAGENWRIAIPRRPEQLVYEGSASPEWLQPGMIVRFYAVLPQDAKRLQAQAPVQEMTVVTLRPGIEAGVFPAAQEVEGEEEVPAKNDDSGEKTAKKKRGRRTVPPPVRCLVIGRLLEIKGNRVEVAAGRLPVRAEIAETMKVPIVVNDYRLAREGDQVELSARYFPNRKGQAEAEQMTITAAKPLAVASKRAARNNRRKGTRKD